MLSREKTLKEMRAACGVSAIAPGKMGTLMRGLPLGPGRFQLKILGLRVSCKLPKLKEVPGEKFSFSEKRLPQIREVEGQGFNTESRDLETLLSQPQLQDWTDPGPVIESETREIETELACLFPETPSLEPELNCRQVSTDLEVDLREKNELFNEPRTGSREPWEWLPEPLDLEVGFRKVKSQQSTSQDRSSREVIPGVEPQIYTAMASILDKPLRRRRVSFKSFSRKIQREILTGLIAETRLHPDSLQILAIFPSIPMDRALRMEVSEDFRHLAIYPSLRPQGKPQEKILVFARIAASNEVIRAMI